MHQQPKQLGLAWTMYASDNNNQAVNFNTLPDAAGDKPWLYQAPPPVPASIPPGTTSQTDKDVLTLQACYQQGALWSYAPNPGIIHCPADARFNLPYKPGNTVAPGNFAYASYAGSGGFGSTFAMTIKNVATLLHPSERYLWVEENDPRGDNESWWYFNVSTATPPFTGSAMLDSGAVWHGNNSTFSWADGHVEDYHWVNPEVIAYNASQNPGKYGSPPTLANNPRDVYFLANGYASSSNP